MVSEAIQLLQTYGWATVFLFVTFFILTKYVGHKYNIWKDRNIDRREKEDKSLKDELSNHQFFSNLTYKINNEIPTLDFNGKETPVRQKMFRDLLELKLIVLRKVVENIITTDMGNMTPSQWASFINHEMQQGETRLRELSLEKGMSPILINKFMVWRKKTNELLKSYINDLAISPVYSTNVARTNTLLYLLNLKLITLIGDAERTLIDLNGEISGMFYQGEEIE